MDLKIVSLERNPWLWLNNWKSLETFAKIISVTSISVIYSIYAITLVKYLNQTWYVFLSLKSFRFTCIFWSWIFWGLEHNRFKCFYSKIMFVSPSLLIHVTLKFTKLSNDNFISVYAHDSLKCLLFITLRVRNLIVSQHLFKTATPCIIAKIQYALGNRMKMKI